MSYMFELFDIVAGARNRGENSHSDLENAGNNIDKDNGDGESQELNELPSNSSNNNNYESDSDIVGNDEDGIKVENKGKGKRGRTLSGNNKFKLNLDGAKQHHHHNSSSDSPRAQLQNKLASNYSQQLDSSTAHLTLQASTDSTNNNEDTKDQSNLNNSQNSENGGGATLGNGDGGDGKETPGGDDKGEFPSTMTKKEKIFIKTKSLFKKEYAKKTLKYHGFIFLFAMLLTILACGYITFYITFGSRYTFEKDMDKWPKWAKAASIVTGIINEQFLVSIGYVLNRSQFGHKKTKVSIPVALAFSLLSIIFTTLGRVYNISGTLNYIPKYLLTLGNIVFVSLTIGIKTFKRPMFAFWFSLPFLFMALFLIGYDYLLLKWYLAETTSEFAKSVVRIVVHPIITALCLLVSRICANQISIHKPKSVMAFVLLPLCFNTFFGRFFGNTMNTLVGLTISSLILSLADMIWKCSLRARDSFIVKYLCRCSKNATFYMQYNLPLYAEYQSYELIYEIASNFVSTFLIITFFFVYDPAELNLKFQFTIMAIQFAFSIVTELVVSYVSLV
eukprot:gene2238-2760_t